MTAEEDLALGEGKSCFIVTPIGSKLARLGTAGRVAYEDAIQMWEDVFKPACEVFGLHPVRADKMSQPGELPEQIFQLLRDSDVVVADLSNGNPNVMYELGLRHTRNLLTVQIGEYGRLPFDVNTIRTIQFTRSEAGLIEVRKALTDSLRSGLKGEATPVTATRVWGDATGVDAMTIARAVAESAEPDDFEEPDEPGFMDVLAEGEDSITHLSEILGAAIVQIEEIGRLGNAASAEIEASDRRGGGFSGRLRVAGNLAEHLREPGEDLERLAEEFRRDVEATGAMITYILERAEADEHERGDSTEFLKSVLAMIEASKEGTVGITTMVHGAVEMRKISRVLKEPSHTIERALNRFAASSNELIAFEDRVRVLLPRDGEASN